jgi:hypothetical protein
MILSILSPLPLGFSFNQWMQIIGAVAAIGSTVILYLIYRQGKACPRFMFVVSQADRETWKENYNVVSKALIPKYNCEVHFLGFSVMNYGRGVAGESKGYLSLTERPTLTSYLQASLGVDYTNIVRTYKLRWAEPDVRKIESKADTVGKAVLGALPESVVIVPPQGEILNLLFTVKGDDEAYLATERLIPLKIPSRTYVVITVASTNPPVTDSAVFCIVLKSWDKFDIERISAWSLLSSSIRKGLSFRKKNGSDESAVQRADIV